MRSKRRHRRGRSRAIRCAGIGLGVALVGPPSCALTQTIDAGALRGPVVLAEPVQPPSRMRIIGDPPPPPPPPRPGDASASDDTDTTTASSGPESGFARLIDARSRWHEVGLEDPRIIVLGCPDRRAWVWTKAPSGVALERRIGRVVAVMERVEEIEELPSRDALTAWVRMIALNPYAVGTRVQRDEIPPWSIFARCPEVGWVEKVAVEQCWGWPFRSAHSVLWFESVEALGRHKRYEALPDYGRAGGFPTLSIPLAPFEFGKRSNSRHLPTGLVLSAYLGNAVIYGGAAWATIVLGTAAQGRVRRNRGRCPSCAYRLDRPVAEGCPECGWGRG